MSNIERLNDILFEQLETLSKTNVEDENFNNTRAKAEAVWQTADRIIRNLELELRNQVWQATRRFSLATREQKQIRIGRSSVDVD